MARIIQNQRAIFKHTSDDIHKKTNFVQFKHKGELMPNLSFDLFLQFYNKYLDSPECACLSSRRELFASENALSRLHIICDKLIDNAKKFNLTAILDPEEIVRKHVIDSLLPLGFLLDEGFSPRSVLDVGCGAGFPLFPMAAVLSDISGTRFLGLDSTAKKISHITETAKAAEMMSLSAVAGRAEELSHGKMREKYDLVTARAVASLPILIELCAPFVAKGGIFAALKSHVDGELENADLAAPILGMENIRKIDYEIPGGDKRCLIIYRKLSDTPKNFPRRYSDISKHPLP